MNRGNLVCQFLKNHILLQNNEKKKKRSRKENPSGILFLNFWELFSHYRQENIFFLVFGLSKAQAIRHQPQCFSHPAFTLEKIIEIFFFIFHKSYLAEGTSKGNWFSDPPLPLFLFMQLPFKEEKNKSCLFFLGGPNLTQVHKTHNQQE